MSTPAKNARGRGKGVIMPLARARAIWLNAQKLDQAAPFGAGPLAAYRATQHLGYVQIDTINVIERCHHHILFSRIPDYRREDLSQAQTADKSVFEYWTHALSYVASEDYRFFRPAMKRAKETPGAYWAAVDPKDLRRLLRRIRENGPLSIRDIDDDVLVEKDHAWGSRKPSRRALQLAFYRGDLTVSERVGMLKKYELTERHFGWSTLPRPATERQVDAYILDRALRSQGIISLDSVCHLDAGRKPAIAALITKRVKRKQLVPIILEGFETLLFWADPAILEQSLPDLDQLVHILSPFDPLIIQRKRLKQFFGYGHLFEAYVPPEKRVLGYFALPVLYRDRIVAAIDMKTDRQNGALLIQKWTKFGEENAEQRQAIEEGLARFETFQLASNIEAANSQA